MTKTDSAATGGLMDNKISITVEVGLGAGNGNLQSFSDVYLHQLFHLSQMNPAPFGDAEASGFAETVKNEIVRRWLLTAPTELYHHQGRHFLFKKLQDLEAACEEKDVDKTDGRVDDHV